MKNIFVFLIVLGSIQTWAEDEVLQEAQAMMQDRGQIEKLAQEDSGVKRWALLVATAGLSMI